MHWGQYSKFVTEETAREKEYAALEESLATIEVERKCQQ